PYIVQTSVNSISNTPLTTIDVTFSNAINASSFTADDVAITDQNSNGYPVNVQTVNSQTFKITLLNPLTDGQYSLKIGPNIQGQNGLLLDQNNNKTPGEEQDVYIKNFSIDTVPPVPTVLGNYT